MAAPAWLDDAIFYQIFPDRFANGDRSIDPPDVVPWDAEPTRDNFFGGDLAGITARLDHIEALGANAIYLTPIFEADTNHRYDGKDYFAIDHRLGDLDGFHRFLAEAHARGIRVVLDAVLNHSGDGHWAFRDVVEHEEDSPYASWYSVQEYPVVPHPTPNYLTCSGCHYLPKWNTYDPGVREHHLDVARYWLDQGIDGWRLDVPYFVHRDFWREFRKAVKAKGEDRYIVAEEWRAPEQWLRGDIADGTMNYTLRDLILGFTADRTLDAAGFAEGVARLHDRIPEGYHAGMLNLLGSHDTERVRTRHGGDAAATALAFALLFAAEGAPMVYYGDEVGLLGDNDPGCRGAMPWDAARWRLDLLGAVRGLAAVRREQPAARTGVQRVIAHGADVAAVLRSGAASSVLTVVNRGAAAEVPLPDGVGGWRLAAGEGAVRDGSLSLGRTAYAVLVGENPGAVA